MARGFLWLGLYLLASGLGLRAVEDMASQTYSGTAPTSANIPYWTSGWAQPATQPTGYTTTTGWNYIGKLGAESGIYLGNGWVITCAHVGAGNFVLNGVTYPLVPNSSRSFSSNGTPCDFVLFQVSPAPQLPPLTLRQTDPVAGSTTFAMIGYGSPTNVETWGYDTVTIANHSTTLNSAWTTNDFVAEEGDSANYQLVSNDSGGGDFTYNSATKQWELAGLNEANNAVDGSAPTVSFFIQLDTYAAQIQAIYNPLPIGSDAPAMPGWALALMGGLLALVATRAVLFMPR